MGTHVLLESAKVAKISRFIHVSTDEVYGEQTMDQEAMSEEQVFPFYQLFRFGTLDLRFRSTATK
jgi:dTDP-D-glucose 4,6-dehydratase